MIWYDMMIICYDMIWYMIWWWWCLLRVMFFTWKMAAQNQLCLRSILNEPGWVGPVVPTDMLLTGPCFHGKKRIATTFNRCVSIFEEGPFRGGKKVHPQWIKVVSPIFGSKPGRCHNGPWHTAWLHPRTVTWSGWMRRDGNDSNVAFQGS